MTKRRYAALLVILVLGGPRFIARAEAEFIYPFSKLINWTEESQRKNYEKYLISQHVAIKKAPVAYRDTAMRLANTENCIFLKKDEIVLGYGFIAEHLILLGITVNQNGDKKRIDIDKVEIFYDIDGRSIFLVSYQTRLTRFERFMAKLLGYEPDGKRKIISDGDLGEGYEFSPATRRLIQYLSGLPKKCFEGLEKKPDTPIELPFNEKLFKDLPRKN